MSKKYLVSLVRSMKVNKMFFKKKKKKLSVRFSCNQEHLCGFLPVKHDRDCDGSDGFNSLLRFFGLQ